MKPEAISTILKKSAVIVLLGAFSYPEINILGILAIIPITLILVHSILKGDHFSFLLQIFVGCHFTYGKQIGGVYTLAGLIAIIVYETIVKTTRYKKPVRHTSLTTFQRSAIVAIAFIQIVSLTFGSNFEEYKKIISVIYFIALVQILLFCSKIIFSQNDGKRLVIVSFAICLYMLLVALNQSYNIIPSNALFPTYTENAVFEKGIFRSSGTFLNFEFFGEYSLTIILMLVPGIISGSINKLGRGVRAMALATILISLYCILLSGTRSSLILLPILFIPILFQYGKYMKVQAIFFYGCLLLIGLVFFSIDSFVDLKSFSERNENFKVFSVDKIISGEALNRAGTFQYGLEKIGKKIEDGSIFIGEGYYTTRDEYKSTHFDKSDIIFPDYHNLYMSSVVLWGIPGAILMTAFLISFLVKGFKTYGGLTEKTLHRDLIFGLNLSFTGLLINQFKIQFIRDSNYFTLIVVLLALYAILCRSKMPTKPQPRANESTLVH